MPVRSPTVLGICAALVAALAGLALEKSVGLSSLIPLLFTSQTDIERGKRVPGAGPALDSKRRGNAPGTFAQAKSQEEKFISDGNGPKRTVLIIDEPYPSVGVPTTFSATLRATLAGDPSRVTVYNESLDFTGFNDAGQWDILRTYFHQKYGHVELGAVAAVGLSAFEFAKRLRSELWPGVPVVFAAIDELSAAELKLDPDMTGLVMHRSIRSMIVAARFMVPDLKGIAVLGGALDRDPYRRQYLRELRELEREIEVTNLSGLPLAEQAVRAATLPSDTAILYTAFFIDNSGARYSSTDALAAIARSANR